MPKSLVIAATFVIALFFSFSLGVGYSPQPIGKPNFKAIRPFSKRQQAFISFMVPKINHANALILETREQVELFATQYQQTQSLSAAHRIWLREIADVYKVPNFSIKKPKTLTTLLRRIDTVPPSLVTAQAAVESAWGTSRFAVQADNFFGQHCYVAGCGLVPLSRAKGARFEVQKFANAQHSIRSYLYNINTNRAYRGLRNMRAALREKGQPTTGLHLVTFLENYSSLGHRYGHILSSVITQHNLTRFDTPMDAAVDPKPSHRSTIVNKVKKPQKKQGQTITAVNS